jgi:hypothetical protein
MHIVCLCISPVNQMRTCFQTALVCRDTLHVDDAIKWYVYVQYMCVISSVFMHCLYGPVVI